MDANDRSTDRLEAIDDAAAILAKLLLRYPYLSDQQRISMIFEALVTHLNPRLEQGGLLPYEVLS